MTSSKRPIWIVTALYWVGIFTLTHIPATKIPPVPVSDKVEHMTAYGILGILLFACLSEPGRSRWVAAGAVIVVGLLYGVADELLQIPVGRACDIQDWYADAAGLGIGVIVCVLVDWLGSRRTNRVT
jgi:VanZ family protein